MQNLADRVSGLIEKTQKELTLGASKQYQKG